MKRLLGAYLLAVVGCAPLPANLPAATTISIGPLPSTSVQTVVIHADQNWSTPARAILREAADKWTRASRRRVEIEFDMDPSESDQRVLATWVTSGSSLVAALDAQFSPGVPVAANIHTGSGTTLVVFILDRIDPRHFESIVTHEFGHVLGIHDLPIEDSVMSGAESDGDVVPSELTPADLEACRVVGVCD